MRASQLAILCIAAALAACSYNAIIYTPEPVAIGGTITGLDGSGLVLTNNGGDDLAVSGSGAFTFATPLERGTSYALAVKSNPSNPTQLCSLTNGSGIAGNEDVLDVQVSCQTSTFRVGGTVTGLAGSGLVLQNNGGNDLAVSEDGSFTFVTPIASGSTFGVTVLAQPAVPSQTCTVSGDTGTVGGAAVTSVAVNCTTNRYTISGTISGLDDGTVTLQNSSGDDLVVTSNGTFAFPTPVLSKSTYNVTVLTQPTGPSQTCTVTAGSGEVTNAAVTSVVVTCTTNRYSIGGTVTGLANGNTITLRNGGDNLVRTENGSFTFLTQVASGQSYAVTVVANPTSPISQTCTVTNGAGDVGSGAVTSVQVTCTTNRFTIGGTGANLAFSAFTGLVLQNNGVEDLTISADATGTFAFTLETEVESGATYNVAVKTSPSGRHCFVEPGGSGSVGASNVTNVRVTCI
jgi:hypothetical protein